MKKIYFLFILSILFSAKILFAQVGSSCANPELITSLPFSLTGLNTGLTADNYDVTPCADATIMAGNDYVFSYTPAANEVVNISLANVPALITAGIFVTDLCPDAPGAVCVGHAIGSLIASPVISNLSLTAGVEYFIIISSGVNFLGQGQTITFDISMQACGSAPVAGFIYLETDTIVSFTNTSSDAVSYEWLFGDEAIHNWFFATNDTNPVHTYSAYGTYTVEMVATNSCGSTDTVVQVITLTCPGNLPIANFTYNDLGGGAFQFSSSSTDATSYEWFMDYPPGFLPAQYSTENANHTFMANGTYTVYLVVNNLCGSDTLTASVNVIGVKIDAINNNYSVKYYPNPVHDVLFVEMNSINAGTILSIVDILGNEITKETIEATGSIKKRIDLSDFAKGIYFIKVYDNYSANITRLFVE